MNFAKFLIRTGSEGKRESSKNSRMFWYARWRDEVVDFGNCDREGDQSDYDGTRRQEGIMGLNGGGSRGVAVHKVVTLVSPLDRTVENASFLSTRSNGGDEFCSLSLDQTVETISFIWSFNPMA